VTVPHCYPSVVLNTLEITVEVGVRVEVEFIVTGKGTRVAVGSGMEVNCASRTKVTSIVTCNTGMMGSNAIVEMMGGVMDSVPLIDFREAVGTRGCNVNMWLVRRSGSGDRGKARSWSNTRTSGRGIAMTTLMTPFTTIVAGTMEGGPKRLVRDEGSVDKVVESDRD